MAQYFFMFSQGSYSDYGPTGLYVCDHPVSGEEWKSHYSAWEQELNSLRDKLCEKFGYSYYHTAGAMESFEYKAFDEFRSLGPEATFAAMHDMKSVEYEELWRDV